MISLASVAALICLGQGTSAQDIYRKALPSVMSLTVERNDGSRVIGTAFMAVRNGFAVTAWHVVRDATRVTAMFSDGQVYECTGLADKDEARDVALIRVRVVDKPLLSLAKTEPEVGSKAFIIGAPQGLDFSITDGIVSQVRSIDGFRQIQFSCPTSPGNSGGPLLSETGEVNGVVSWQFRDGQNLNFGIPSAFVRALDDSLPTTPWNKVEARPATVDQPDPIITSEISEGLKILWSLAAWIHLDTEEIMRANRGSASPMLVEGMIRVRARSESLKSHSGQTTTLRQVASVLASKMSIAATAADELEECSKLKDIDRLFDSALVSYVASYRLAELDDRVKEVLSSPELLGVRRACGELLYHKIVGSPEQKGWKPGEMSRTSRKRFEGGFSLLSRLALDVDSTGYLFGFLVDPTNAGRLLEVHGGTPPKGWGFQKGDVVQSVDGAQVDTYEALKVAVLAKPTKQAEVVVLRDGKPSKLHIDAKHLAP